MCFVYKMLDNAHHSFTELKVTSLNVLIYLTSSPKYFIYNNIKQRKATNPHPEESGTSK